MRIIEALYLGVFGLVGLVCQGCSPIAHAARTTICEPTEYSRRLDNAVDECRNEDLAEEAWEKFAEGDPGKDYSPDFSLGFKEGYADYLYAGGPGNPPPVPPRYYWRPEFETPEGHQAIDDWFAGFRRGAALARASGYRELVTLPSSVPPPGPPYPPVPPLPPSAGAQGATSAPEGELPPPRPVPESGKERLPPPRKVPAEPEPDKGR